MPTINEQIGNPFGPKPPKPTPTPSGTSLFAALSGLLPNSKPAPVQKDPYQNAAKVLAGG